MNYALVETGFWIVLIRLECLKTEGKLEEVRYCICLVNINDLLCSDQFRCSVIVLLLSCPLALRGEFWVVLDDIGSVKFVLLPHDTDKLCPRKCIWTWKLDDVFSIFSHNNKFGWIFLSACRTADFVVALLPEPCSFLEKNLLLWASVSYWPVISTPTAAPPQTHVLHADVMTFCVSVLWKVTRKTIELHSISNLCAQRQHINRSAITIYGKHPTQ